MGAAISYNRLRAMKARENAAATSVVEHRQHYLRLAFQYDAIVDLEGARPRLVRPRQLWVVGEDRLWQSLPHERSSSRPGLQ
ncbi:MAG: hypothetical protein EON56_01205 [Alphaproteobacteria bacterium]|nr:MAG: hypothetical protein EON56_01205 [Alphaproteobacteria bacterium]